MDRELKIRIKKIDGIHDQGTLKRVATTDKISDALGDQKKIKKVEERWTKRQWA